MVSLENEVCNIYQAYNGIWYPTFFGAPSESANSVYQDLSFVGPGNEAIGRTATVTLMHPPRVTHLIGTSSRADIVVFRLVVH